MSRVLRAAAAAAVAMMAFSASTVLADPPATVVDQFGPHWSKGDTRVPGAGIFESGPIAPIGPGGPLGVPLGAGSFELRTPDGLAKVQLMTDLQAGTPLAQVQGLTYSTYRDPASTGATTTTVAAINIRVDTNGDGFGDRYVIYEPSDDRNIGGTPAVPVTVINKAVLTGQWQGWDAIRGGNARWWISGTNPPGGCTQGRVIKLGTPTLRNVTIRCSWNEVLAALPGAVIKEGADGIAGSFGVNQGSTNSGIISNADALAIKVGSVTTTYDFEPPPPDADGDGVPDATDNCPNVVNPAPQIDTDSDGAGNPCDADDDEDGVVDTSDNCQLVSNPGQADNDGDAYGDACDSDDDNDGVADTSDNCQFVSNLNQADNDGDAYGDACDSDDDNDGVDDTSDNCQFTSNPGQANNDSDGLGDACDADDDNDGVTDGSDNCQFASNGNQLDADGDGLGAACDSQELPLSASDCKKNSWQSFNGTATFKNQGDCVSYVATGGRNRPADS